MRGAQREGGAQALVGERRGHADVDDGDVGQRVLGREPGHPRDELVAVRDRGDDLVAAAGDERDEAVAQDGGVLGDDEPHGVLPVGRAVRRPRRAVCPGDIVPDDARAPGQDTVVGAHVRPARAGGP